MIHLINGLSKVSLIIMISVSVWACTSSAPSPDASLIEANGKPMDHLWVKPGVNFKTYQALLLDEVTVSYREKAYQFSRISKHELKKRLDSSADLLKRQFKTSFEIKILEQERYQIAQQPGPGVLKLTPSLMDVYLVNPDEKLATSRQKVLSYNTGDMTLKMEVRDSISGELLAVVQDQQSADNWFQMQRQDNMTLIRETRLIFSRWARWLSDGLLDNHNQQQ